MHILRLLYSAHAIPRKIVLARYFIAVTEKVDMPPPIATSWCTNFQAVDISVRDADIASHFVVL